MPKKIREIKGKFIGNEVGYGFVIPEDSQAEDIFIPPSSTWGAIHGDEVVCRLLPKKPVEPEIAAKKGRRTPKAQRQKAQSQLQKPQRIDSSEGNRQSGEIIEITHRKPLIGTYFAVGSEGYIRPIEKKIPHIFTVPQKSKNRFGLVEGHRVVFLAPKPKGIGDRRTPYRQSHTLPCHVTEVLGHIHDPGIDVLTLVYRHNIPHEFPDEVLAQAASLPDAVALEDLRGRLDLRDKLIFTIDGEDTKDIDDAISFARLDSGYWQLGVHIADVSHYVQEGTPLDREALHRGTSVYLADRVIPMLPHRLSSGICSIFPDVDRLAISCIMTVDGEGNVVSYEIAPSVINSKRRWTYQEVQGILEDESGSGQELFLGMDKLRETLYQKRRSRGALDFNLPEAKIRVDESGRPISVESYNRTRATGIIEEFMILCNETIATYAISHDALFIYRTHEAPAQEKLAQLRGIAQSFGLSLPPVLGAKALQRLLESAEGSPAYQAIAMAALTSLPQAYYTPESPKHYGLASEAYCHFTSPIRRYADLEVHRIIKKLLQDGASRRKAEPSVEALFQPAKAASPTPLQPPGAPSPLHAVAAQCSRTERQAEALEREVTQLKKVQFMQGKEGQNFEGTVSGITPWGVYVMLPSTIEGLIPNQQLKRFGYTHDKDGNRYANKRSRDVIAMGAPVQVVLVDASEEEARLTFGLIM